MVEWRARFFVKSFADFPADLKLTGARVNTHAIELAASGLSVTLVDVFLNSDVIRDAYFYAIDIVEDLVDVAAYLSFASCSYEIVGVAPEVSKLGTPFQVALPLESYRRSRTKLDSKKIENLIELKSQDDAIALHAFRSGVSADSPYEFARELWTSVETMGAKSARMSNDFNDAVCDGCGSSRRIGLRSAKHAKQFFRDSEWSNPDHKIKKIAEDAYQLSNQLEHGGKLRDATLRAKADLLGTAIQTAAATAIVESTGVKPDINHCPRLGMRCVSLEGVRTGPNAHDCDIRPLIWDGKVQVSILPNALTDAKPGDFWFEVGLTQPIPIHPLLLPEVQEDGHSWLDRIIARINELSYQQGSN